MQNEIVSGRQMAAWIFVAMTAPLAQIASAGGWLQAVILGAVGWIFCLLALGCRHPQPKWICVVQWIWVTLTLMFLLRETANAWPMGKGYPVIPITLALLAAWSARKGASAAAGAAGTLSYIVGIGFLLVLAAGLGRVSWERERAVPETINENLLLIFLLPCAAAAIPRDRGTKRALSGCFVFAVVSAIVVQGILSVNGLQGVPFYEMSRGLELLGVWERFEALVCALLTVGWTALLTLLATAAGSLVERVAHNGFRWGVWGTVLVAVAGMLCNMRTNIAILGIYGLICWGLLPLLAQAIVSEKKM